MPKITLLPFLSNKKGCSETVYKKQSHALSSRCRKPTLPPNPLSIFKEQVRERHHSDSQKGQQTRRPLITERPVHLHSK